METAASALCARGFSNPSVPDHPEPLAWRPPKASPFIQSLDKLLLSTSSVPGTHSHPRAGSCT